MRDLQKEIDDMIGAIAPATPAVDEKAAFGEETPKEEPKEEPAEKPKEVEEESKEEPPGETKGDVIEEEPTPPTEPEAPATPAEDPRIAAMQETINQLSQRLLQGGTVPTEAPKPPTETVPQQTPQPPQVDLDMSKFQIFPEGVEFEDIVNDKGVFERFMRDVLSRYEISRVRRDTLVAPQLVSRQVQYFMNLNEAVRTFYDSNKDLVNVKPLVGAFTNRIVADHPDWSLPQVMEEAAKATRQAIGLGAAHAKVQAQAATPTPPKPAKPSFVQQGATRNTQQGKKTELQSQIDDLITGY